MPCVPTIRQAVPALALVLGLAVPAPAAAPGQTASAPGHPGPAAPSRSAPAGAPRLETATFAGGCFWCVETQFEGVPGVRSVVSGYTGGQRPDPTYHEVGNGTTGHYEAVEIRYDPARVSYAALLEMFWHSIDPTQADGQFCDIGSQYRTAIFYHGGDQHRLAEQSRRKLAATGGLNKPIATRILPAGSFYPAEEYHQDFWKKDPVRYRTYRTGCGRDRRLAQVWGRAAAKPTVH